MVAALEVESSARKAGNCCAFVSIDQDKKVQTTGMVNLERERISNNEKQAVNFQ